MRTQPVVLTVLLLTLAVGSGCGVLHRVAYCPLGPCGPGWGEAGWAAPCGPCGEMACDTCGPTVCEPTCEPDCCDGCGDCQGHGPYRPFAHLVCFLRLFHPVTWCGPVCGERYWGDFYSDPPDCWDPCDPCGNWVGGCPPRAPHCGRKGFSCGPAVSACGCAEPCESGCEVGCGGMVGSTQPVLGRPRLVGGPSTGPWNARALGNRVPSLDDVVEEGPMVLPAPKLISVVDKKVEPDDQPEEQPTVAKRPTSTR